MISAFSQILAFALSLQGAQPAPDGSEPQTGAQSLRVVELFTSQGCPMCPSANTLLANLGEESNGDVLAIAYGVDYWDVYGWEDTFATASFTARQQAYVDAGEAHRVYTPHFVINGAPEKIRYSEERVRRAANAAPPLPAILETSVSEGRIVVRLDGPVRETPATVWLVTYHDGVETRLIEDGANAGREMVHYNMARDIQALGQWAGDTAVWVAAMPEDGLSAAILVQDGPGGRLIAAARVD